METIDLHTNEIDPTSDDGSSTGVLIRKKGFAVSLYQQAAERDRILGSTFMHDNAALAADIHIFIYLVKPRPGSPRLLRA